MDIQKLKLAEKLNNTIVDRLRDLKVLEYAIQKKLPLHVVEVLSRGSEEIEVPESVVMIWIDLLRSEVIKMEEEFNDL